MNLLKDIYNKIETLKGKKLAVFIVIAFAMSLVIGITIGYFTNTSLKQDETLEVKDFNNTAYPSNLKEMSGKIQYVDPVFYPDQNISYILVDTSGKELILLTAKDDKLKIAEGLTVKVVGTLTKTLDKKKDVLVVQEIQINSVTRSGTSQ